jgi:hypothetical protein
MITLFCQKQNWTGPIPVQHATLFDLPARLVERATPNPYVAPGPAQKIDVLGYRALSVRVFNPPPEGGMSNTINQLVRPR